ncbi:hypothetical protein ABVK25_010035 [Lepraria finkii]|uniref:Uncharacterized protein n=1 Tax=Lepraria finkii TaxID=1340010 RepID=A0ABR4AVK3_9LECA
MQVLGLSLPVLAQRSISPKKSGSSRPRAPEMYNVITRLTASPKSGKFHKLPTCLGVEGNGGRHIRQFVEERHLDLSCYLYFKYACHHTKTQMLDASADSHPLQTPIHKHFQGSNADTGQNCS